MNIPDTLAKEIVEKATSENDINFFTKLIESGFDLNEKLTNGETILFWVAHQNPADFRILEYLIEHGADINAKTNDGSTILHESYIMDEDLINFLIDHGADVNAEDNSGRTPLFFANATSVEILLDRGATITDACNFFDIMNTFDNPYVAADIIIPLIDHGADINQKDKFGKTILQRVQEWLNEENFSNDDEKEGLEYFEQELLSRGAK